MGSGEPCLQLQFGSGYGNINGIVYAPTSQVYQQDNGGGTVGDRRYRVPDLPQGFGHGHYRQLQRPESNHHAAL